MKYLFVFFKILQDNKIKSFLFRTRGVPLYFHTIQVYSFIIPAHKKLFYNSLFDTTTVALMLVSTLP